MAASDAPRVAIIDYGVGNLRSVEKAFAAMNCEAVVSDDERVLREAERLVLPGVGAFAACMKALKERGFDELVRERVSEGTPLLGVCVGMQMLFEESEEFGQSEGLGLLRGRVRRFTNELLVPQMGWNQVRRTSAHPLLANIEDKTFFYFVHSYYCDAADAQDVIGETEYGVAYSSIVARGNICGVQFHPEKSQTAGLQLLKNFAECDVKTLRQQYACPCCGYLTLSEEPPGTYEICSICFWEDDAVQFNSPDNEGGANKVSLRQAQRNFVDFGACERRVLSYVRKPSEWDRRSSNWKPL